MNIFSFEKLSPERKLRLLRGHAFIILLAEMLVRTFWRPFFLILLFLTLWLWEIPRLSGPVAEALAVILFAGGLIESLRRGSKHFLWPSKSAIDRRIEEDNRLTHRPLIHLSDKPALTPGDTARDFWEHKSAQARNLIKHLTSPTSRDSLALHDPFAFRFVIFILFFAGLIVAGPKSAERIAYGLLPFSVHWTDKSGDTLALWITPPAYTKLPQIIIKGTGTADKTITVPAGSIIKARVSGGFGAPYIEMGHSSQKMERLDQKSWNVEIPAVPGDKIVIRQMFFPRINVPVFFGQDQPPHIEISADPKTNPPGVLEFSLKLRDDYGINNLVMDMKLDPSVEHAPNAQEFSEQSATPCTAAQECNINPVYDLSAHHWAGLAAQITFTAIDHAGQKTVLEPISVVLPERTFQNATARQLAMMRKRLIWTPDAAAANVAAELGNIIISPKNYRGDYIVFLSLRSMISRLSYERMPKSVTSIIPQLWDTALRLEDGNVSLAARDLREARQALEELLSDPNAKDEDIAIEMEKLRTAMERYMQEMAQNIAQNMAQAGLDPQSLSADMFENILSQDDLQAFMDQMRAQALSGDRESARQMLAQMQQMMDSMSGSGTSEPPKELQDMMQTAQKINDVLERQKKLLSQTTEGKTSPQELSKEQEKLRHDLGEAMAQAGEILPAIPDSLQDAEGEMRNAGERMGEGKINESLPHQEKAIKHMQQQKKEMSRQIAQMLKKMAMMALGEGQMDPLGRPSNKDGKGQGLFPGSTVKIPDEATRRRAHEILNILREKSGEYSRPEYERDYFNRLLKQF